MQISVTVLSVLAVILFLFNHKNLLFKLRSAIHDALNSNRVSLKVKKTKTIADIPGPRTLPLFGASWLYSRFGPYTMEKYHEANDDKYKRFGPVVREEVLFNFPLVHLFNKDDIEKILGQRTQYPLRPANEADVYYRKSRPDYYNNIGMVNENGPAWHSLRSQLTPPLSSPQTLKRYAGHIDEIARDFTDLVAKSADSNGQVNDFKKIMYRAGLESVCMVALERRMGFLEEQISFDLQNIMDAIQGYQASSTEAMYGLPLWKYLPESFSGAFTSLVKNKDMLFETFGKIVDETMSDECVQDDQSILRQLMNNDVDIKDVKASVVDYITAGVDTIGHSIIFNIALIAKHPEVQAKLHEEIDAILGDDDEISMNKIAEMKYLKACVQESYRMYPTACQIARIIEEPTTVTGGYQLPKYSVVLCHQRIAALQNENFSQAKDYLPGRWLNDSRKEKGLVLPFGTGKRMCPGKRLAEQEIFILTAKLFQRYKVALVDEFAVEFNFLLTPAGQMRMRFEER